MFPQASVLSLFLAIPRILSLNIAHPPRKITNYVQGVRKCKLHPRVFYQPIKVMDGFMHLNKTCRDLPHTWLDNTFHQFQADWLMFDRSGMEVHTYWFSDAAQTLIKDASQIVEGRYLSSYQQGDSSHAAELRCGKTEHLSASESEQRALWARELTVFYWL